MTDMPDTHTKWIRTGYVAEVITELRLRGVVVTGFRVRILPHLLVELTVAEAEPPIGRHWDGAERFRLGWDENAGWFWQAAHQQASRPRGAVFFGITTRPPAPEVAVWMALSLALPDVTARMSPPTGAVTHTPPTPTPQPPWPIRRGNDHRRPSPPRARATP